MAKRDHFKYGLILGIIVCCCSAALTALDNVASVQSTETTGNDPIKSWPHLQQSHPHVDAKRAVSGQEDHGSQPVLTTVSSTISAAAVAAEATPSPFPTAAPMTIGSNLLNNNNPIFQTISSLSSAFQEAESRAIYISSLLATSIIGLHESIDSLTSSASSALASVQASASSAIASAEKSASDAVVSAERSASSSVSSMSEMLDQGELVTVTVTATVVSVTTDLVGSTITVDPSSTMVGAPPYTGIHFTVLLVNMCQAPNDPQASNDSDIEAVQGAALSVNRAAIAVVVAIIGSSVLSLAGFYLFVRYRKRKQKQKEEEQNVSDALDRAIVNYIVKDQASPTTITSNKDGGGEPSSPTSGQPEPPIHLETIQEAETPPPISGGGAIGIQAPRPPPVRRPSQAYRPAAQQQTPQTPQFGALSDDISPRKIGQALSKDYSPIPSVPGSAGTLLPSPGPPPTIPLPTPPATKDIRRNISIRYAPSEGRQDSVYGDILARPLTNTSVMSGATSAAGGYPLGHARTVSSTVAGSGNNIMVGRMGSGASARSRGHARGPSSASNLSVRGRRRAASTGSVRSTMGVGMGMGQQQQQDQQQLLPPQEEEEEEGRDGRRDSNWPLPKNGFL
ncbi:hypothetical protein B0T20DRAFT_453084 [Sordaria brevicollis]|uniref:Uncharacterized protein n=1 Tax=Sordaria brevicollis TaxID=83679 RepID=A0AAE0UCC7_SORBR|nr:hypothetical protein B0T20DRAFT_453084 [Sordaria brevicollis]